MSNQSLKLNHHKAFEYPISTIVEVLNRAFDGYIGGSMVFTNESFLKYADQYNVNLGISDMVTANEHPAGLALISRFGNSSRIAAMGVIKEYHNKGVGTWLLKKSIQETKVRGDQTLQLECIEQNIRAVNLYKKAGFSIIRRLEGFIYNDPEGANTDGLESIAISEIAKLVVCLGGADLPWQVNGYTLAKFGPPNLGYQLGPAYGIISDTKQETIVIRSIFVLPDARNQGYGHCFLKTLFHKFPGKKWVVPSICPQEYSGFFTSLGFESHPISQFHMSIKT